MPTDYNISTKDFSLGQKIDCFCCGTKSTVILNGIDLECNECGVILGEYDDNDIERVSYDDTGNLSGRGFGVKVGEQLPGTTMDSGKGISTRIIRLNSRIAASNGPSAPKLRAMELIKTNAKSDAHKRKALEFLDIGWPSDSDKSNQHTTIWWPAKPYGVECSAAVCLHLSAQDNGVDSQLKNWVTATLPSVRSGNPMSYAYRSQKKMKEILMRKNRLDYNRSKEWKAVLAKANIGSTEYRDLRGRILDAWYILEQIDSNMLNHPRNVLAALCHLFAKQNGIKPDKEEIMTMFGTTSSYYTWIPRLKSHLFMQ